MNPSPTENILVYVLWALAGLVVAQGGALVWVIKSKRGNGNGQKSGERSVIEWEARISGIVEKALEKFMIERDYHVRDIIRQELDRDKK